MIESTAVKKASRCAAASGGHDDWYFPIANSSPSDPKKTITLANIVFVVVTKVKGAIDGRGI
jgi:hypothetical protein